MVKTTDFDSVNSGSSPDVAATPYLILHKVRGLPAFDIAERNDDMGTPSDPGPWWIIPTSGHRAYPARWWDVDDLCDGSDYDAPKPNYVMIDIVLDDSLPDHYAASASRSRLATAASDILSLMGLAKRNQPPVKRRVVP